MNVGLGPSAEDPGDSGEVCCRGGATASCRFPIPHPVLLGSTASVHALQHSLALSSPTDTSASSTLPQATAEAEPVKFEAGRAPGGHRHIVIAVLQGSTSFHLTCSRCGSSCVHPVYERRRETATSRVARDRHHTAASRSVPRPTPHAQRHAPSLPQRLSSF